MIGARFALLFIIYSSQLFLGTPTIVVALQMLAFLVASIASAFQAVRSRSWVFPGSFRVFLLLFFCFLAVAILVAMERGITPAIIMARFLQVFLTTIAIPLLVYAYIALGIMTAPALFKHILAATILYCSLKLGIDALVLVFHIPYAVLFAAFWAVFNTAPTFGEIAFGILRFMAPPDFITPIVLYYALTQMKNWRRVLAVILLCASIFVTEARFIWIEGIVAFLAYFMTFSRRQVMVLILVLLATAPVVFSLQFSVIEKRFSSAGVAQADSIRVQQYSALADGVEDAFFWGHGLGSFPVSMIRDPVTPYNYELQWLALGYQMGMVGIVFLLGLILFGVAPLLTLGTLEAVPILLLVAFSLLSGFANPSLIGRSAGVGFALIYCLGLTMKGRANPGWKASDISGNRLPQGV